MNNGRPIRSAVSLTQAHGLYMACTSVYTTSQQNYAGLQQCHLAWHKRKCLDL